MLWTKSLGAETKGNMSASVIEYAWIKDSLILKSVAAVVTNILAALETKRKAKSLDRRTFSNDWGLQN